MFVEQVRLLEVGEVICACYKRMEISDGAKELGEGRGRDVGREWGEVLPIGDIEVP